MRHAVAALLLALAGCGGARAGSADLQYGFTVASQRAQLAEAAVSDLQDKVVHMQEVLEEQGLDRASGQQSMQQLQADVASVRGAIEELKFSVEGIRSDLDAFRADYERRALHAELRLDQIEEVLGLTPPAAPSLDGTTADAGRVTDTSGAVASASPIPTTASSSGGSADAAAPVGFDERLELAEKRMEEGKQAVARAILEMALQDDPKNAKAPEAAYRLAETWYNEGKWREAAKKFQVVTDDWPKSAWAPWAMLRIGECFDGMGRNDASKTFYEGVVRNFPSSEAAKEAKRKLAR
jgi:tol-pal system protein YbgF